MLSIGVRLANATHHVNNQSVIETEKRAFGPSFFCVK